MKLGLIRSPDNILSSVCYETDVKELIVQGYLCPLITKAGRRRSDTSALSIRDGEFIADEVEQLAESRLSGVDRPPVRTAWGDGKTNTANTRNAPRCNSWRRTSTGRDQPAQSVKCVWRNSAGERIGNVDRGK